jgi:hypothetical protein
MRFWYWRAARLAVAARAVEGSVASTARLFFPLSGVAVDVPSSAAGMDIALFVCIRSQDESSHWRTERACRCVVCLSAAVFVALDSPGSTKVVLLPRQPT